MRVHSAVFDGRLWALGLWWQMLESPKGSRREARAKVADLEEQPNRLAIRRMGDEAQAGYGIVAGEDAKPKTKLFSLAAALADAVGGTWVGSFPLEGGKVWILGVVKGVVLPDGDRVVEAAAGEEVFREVFHILESWDAVHDGFQDPSEAAIFIERGLERAERLCPLEPLHRKFLGPRALWFFAALLVGAAVLWSFGQYKAAQAEKLRLAQLAQVQAQLAAKRAAQAKAAQAMRPEQAFPEVWRKEPAPSAVLAQCREFYAPMGVSERGWMRVGGVCGREGLSLEWKRGELGSFLALPEGAAFDPKDPNRAVSRIKAPQALPPRPAESRLLDVGRAGAVIFEMTRILGLKAHIKWHDREKREVGKGEDGKPIYVQAPFRRADWALSAIVIRPELVLHGLAGIPGLVLKTVEYNFSAGDWTLRGVLYVED